MIKMQAVISRATTHTRSPIPSTTTSSSSATPPSSTTTTLPSSANSSSAPTIADDRLRLAADRFDTFRIKLRHLDSVLRAHHADLKRVEGSRVMVVRALNDVTRGCPVFDYVGSLDAGSDNSNASKGSSNGSNSLLAPEQTTPSSDKNTVLSSYATLHSKLGTHLTKNLSQHYQSAISYISTYEKTISTRISTELKHVEKLHKEWIRYHQKVESLKTSARKKKHVKESESNKIGRNESKLRTAKKEYRRNLVSVTLLTEEVTERGWKDLIPLMIKLISFDLDCADRAGECVEDLGGVLEELRGMGMRYDMDDDMMMNGRLGLLLEEDAMEFVSPEDMQDIESIQPSVGTSSAGLNNNSPFQQGGLKSDPSSGDLRPPLPYRGHLQASHRFHNQHHQPSLRHNNRFPANVNNVTPPCSENDSESSSGDLIEEDEGGPSPTNIDPAASSSPPSSGNNNNNLFSTRTHSPRRQIPNNKNYGSTSPPVPLIKPISNHDMNVSKLTMEVGLFNGGTVSSGETNSFIQSLNNNKNTHPKVPSLRDDDGGDDGDDNDKDGEEKEIEYVPRGPEDEEQHHQAKKYNENKNNEDRQEQEKENIEKDDTSTVRNYPSSIYLKNDGSVGKSVNDDLTTLTPYPDMASI